MDDSGRASAQAGADEEVTRFYYLCSKTVFALQIALYFFEFDDITGAVFDLIIGKE